MVCMQAACWGTVEIYLFSPSQISEQTFPPDSDTPQWRKQQGMGTKKQRKSSVSIKLLLWHQYENDDVILCSCSKLELKNKSKKNHYFLLIYSEFGFRFSMETGSAVTVTIYSFLWLTFFCGTRKIFWKMLQHVFCSLLFYNLFVVLNASLKYAYYCQIQRVLYK